MDMYVNKLLKNKTYERFFLHGIENKETVIEGIIYYSLVEVYANYGKENLYELSNEKLLEKIIEKAVPKYIQFYRFIVMNDTFTENFKNNFVDLDQMKRDIVSTIQNLLNTKRILQIKDENGKCTTKQIDRMIVTKAGIYFTRGEIDAIGLNRNFYYEFKHEDETKGDCIKNYYYEYDEEGKIKNPRGLQGEIAWTKQIYNILEDLTKLEKLDNEKYYISWLYTKLEREKNRDKPNMSSIYLIDNACKAFEEKMAGRELE